MEIHKNHIYYQLRYFNFVVIPDIDVRLVDRQRLTDSMHSNIYNQLILISAPAGYGKTTLLYQFTKKNPALNYYWIQGNELANSPISLLKLFTESFRSKINTFGDEYYFLLETYEKEIDIDNNIYNEFLLHFKNEISKLNGNNILILDDFQVLEQSNQKNKINELVNSLIKDKIHGLTIIISSREDFDIKTAKLEAKRNLFKVSTNDLEFNNEELKVLALDIYNLSLKTDEIDILQNLASGWAAAFHLVFQKGKNWLNELENVKYDDIFRYFTEDIFLNLTDEIRDFIMNSVVLDNFSEIDTNTLFNISNSAGILNQIVKKKIFIETYKDGNNIKQYSYQKLFKEYLLKRLNETNNISVFKNASEYYKKKGDLKKYLFYLLKAGQTDNAVKYFHSIAISLIRDSDFRSYMECLKLFELDSFCDIGFLKYHQYRLALFTGKPIDDLEYLIQEIKSSYLSEYDISIVLAECYFFKNRYVKAEDILVFLLKNTLTAEQSYYCNYLLARTYYRKGADNYKKAIDICEKFGSPESHNVYSAEFTKILGNIYNDMGKITLAIHFYESIISDKGNYVINLKQIANLVELYSTIGDYENAYEYLCDLESSANDTNFSIIQNIVLRANVRFLNNIGDYKEAIKYLNKTLKETDTNRNEILLMTKYLELSEIYWNWNKFNESKEVFILAENIFKNQKSDNYLDIIIPYYKQFIADNSQDFKKTESALLNILRWHEVNKIEKTLGYLLFHTACFYLNDRQFHLTIHYSTQAFNLLHKHGMYSFLENRIINSRVLFDFAVCQSINAKFIKEIGIRFLKKPDLPFLREEYSIELNEKINRFIDIRLRCFGLTELCLRGDLVTEDKWIRKKSKILLVFLMSDPTRIHTKDEIMDIFFDDLPADKADVVYHSAIYNIRTALKIYDIKSDKPKRSKDKTFDYNPQYILYEDKTLRLNPDFYYTSESIEFEKHYNKTRLPALSKEEKISHSVKAIKMYKGDFLPGYYDSWCEELRVKYKNMYITLCEELIKLLESESKYEEVIKYSELLLNEDKLNDSAHISIINAHTKLGNIKMAKSRYEIMLKIYDEELGEKPQPKTLDKITLILS